MFRSVIIASSVLVVAITAQCPSVPDGGCNICGEGECVQSPDEVFVFPGQPTVPCGMLQDAGFNGQIPLDQCPVLPTLVKDVCDCGVSPPPTPAPIVATPAPIPPTPEGSCPGIASSGCSVCGDGLCVQNPSAIFEFPDQPSVACGTLESAGASGLISQGDCAALPSFISVCQCGIPATASPPTPAPVQEPTPPPVQPTPQPVDPTPAPVEDPTPQPVQPTPQPVQPTPPPVQPTPQPVDPTPAPVDPTPAPTNAPLPTPHPIAIYVPLPPVDNSLFSRGGAGMGGVGSIQMQMAARETTVAMTMAIQRQRRNLKIVAATSGIRGAN